MLRNSVYLCLLIFACPSIALAWGGPEHHSITSAAVSVLSPGFLALLGAEAARLIRVYCNYPDFNWAVYGTCSPYEEGTVRTPDRRRDFNASFYCDFDQFTGKGKYFCHGPEIGETFPAPDERAKEAFEECRFNSGAVRKFFPMANNAFGDDRFRDGVRFAGVTIHYLQDGTPPPHVLGVGGGQNQLHHQMEAMSDHSLINIEGYSPKVLAATPESAAEVCAALAKSISLDARSVAKEIKQLIETGHEKEAEIKKAECAKIAARSSADILTTMFELNKNSFNPLPPAEKGVNLLCNSSFDEDGVGDLLPDGWVREWYDLKCPYDMHVWDRVSPRTGSACVKLYGTPEAGSAWRTARYVSIPVQKGERYELQGWIRAEGATGENYIALRFENPEFDTAEEITSKKVNGTQTWQKLRVEAAVPDNAVDVLAICVSKSNTGAVLFDDLSLKKL